MGFLSLWEPDKLTHQHARCLTEGHTDLLTGYFFWETGCLNDWLRAWLTDSFTDWRTNCLVDWLCARMQSFSTCSPCCISVEERCPFPSQCLQCAAQPWECSPASSPHSAWDASPTAAINQHQRLSLSPSPLPFSRFSTPTDMLDEAILKELTDVGWFAPGFLTLPEWCIWCGVYSALINV